jgi:hypothetical protein
MTYLFAKPRLLAAAILLTLLFPPLRAYGSEGRMLFRGYGFLFDVSNNLDIHIPLLLAEWFALIAFSFLFGISESRINEK